MPTYEFVCDNQGCPSNIDLPDGGRNGFEIICSIQEYSSTVDCPICAEYVFLNNAPEGYEKGKANRVYRTAPALGRMNDPAVRKEALIERSLRHSKKQQSEHIDRMHNEDVGHGSIFSMKHQDKLAKAKGLNPRPGVDD